MSERLLGVDLGTRRIGLALSEPGGIVCALTVLDARPTDAENARAILDVAEEYGAQGIVIGLPLNMDDSEGPQAKLSRTLGKAIEQLGGPPVRYHDERLSSHAADMRLAERDLTKKKKRARQDAIAAQVILQSYLDVTARPPSEPPPE